MSWFGGDLEVTLVNGTKLCIGPIRFDEASVKAALDARVRPNFTKELMFFPYPTQVEIPEHHRSLSSD